MGRGENQPLNPNYAYGRGNFNHDQGAHVAESARCDRRCQEIWEAPTYTHTFLKQGMRSPIDFNAISHSEGQVMGKPVRQIPRFEIDSHIQEDENVRPVHLEQRNKTTSANNDLYNDVKPTLNSSNLLARKAFSSDLPKFSGRPEEWPLFISMF